MRSLSDPNFQRYYVVAILGSKAPPLTYASALALKEGEVVEVELRNRLQSAVVLEEVEKPLFECKLIATPPTHAFSPLQQESARFIAFYYCASLGESLGLFTPFKRDSASLLPALDSAPLLPLSPKQEEALRFLLERPSALLFGDTGSGKTEIYAHLIAHHLAQGESAILLMPEISLTPQIAKRLERYFGDSLALWHSKISPAQKRQTLERIAQGEVRLIAGARSALFLPLSRLGLIIVDEEHDDAYKSQQRPLYNARDVALLMGDRGGARVVLGSATPLASSYYRFSQKGAMFRLVGQHFKSEKSLEFIEGLDEPTPAVLAALRETLARGKQAIVFLPTRANFKHLLCDSCGQGVECPNCSVSLSLHKKENLLLCHHCRHASPIPKACPACGAELKAERIGTAQVVEELQGHFPEARIARFDRDSMTSEAKLRATLEAFNRGEIEILVGTQMLSKGHDYHNVELSVVLGIDYLLKSEEYRAHERAVALLWQLAGRSGRREAGRVLVQSFKAEFFRTRLEDYERFLEEELRFRLGRYPPFVKLGALWFIHSDQAKAQRECERACAELEASGVEVISSGIAPLERVAKRWRYSVLVRSKSAKKLIGALQGARGSIGEIDIDPISLV